MPRNASRRLLSRLALAGLLGTAAASVLALWAAEAWFAELFVHFRLQYLAIGLLAAPLLAWRRRWPLTAVAVAIVALNVAPVVAYFETPAAATGIDAFVAGRDAPPVPARLRAPDPVHLRIASANLFFLNDDHAAVLAWARELRPEVLLFLEAHREWRVALAPLQAEYPYHHYATDRSHHGLLLLSRWPLSDLLTRPPDAQDLRPVLFTTVTKDGASLRLAAMHATWPLRPREARQRTRDLAALAAEAARRGALPFVAVGDLNVSPFSPHFQALLRDGGLRSAAAGHGWQPTWPAPFPPLGIQIDHALVSPDVQVQAFARGPGIGSDHRPIVIDVIIRNAPALLSRP